MKAIGYALVAALTACGGGGGGRAETIEVEPPAILGYWLGTWASFSAPHINGALALDLELGPQAFTIEGTGTLSGSQCFTAGAITGDQLGDEINFQAIQGDRRIIFSGVIEEVEGGHLLRGPYTVFNAGVCTGDAGKWEAFKRRAGR